MYCNRMLGSHLKNAAGATLILALMLTPATLLADDNGDNDAPEEGDVILMDPDDVPRDFAWSITRYSSDIDSVIESMNKDLEAGYIPVGIEADPDISILMIPNEEIEFTNWVIHEFSDPESFEDEMTSSLAEGWVPMDIARTENGITALLIETDLAINGWHLEATRVTDEQLTATIDSMADDGYAVWGSALDGEGIWLLGIRETGEPRRDVQYEMYPDDPEALQSAINSHVQELWVPWSMSLSEGQIFLTYLR